MNFVKKIMKWCPEPPRDFRSFDLKRLKVIVRKAGDALIQNVGLRRNIALLIAFWTAFSAYSLHSGPHDLLWYLLNYGMWAIVLYFSFVCLRWVYRRLGEELGWCPIPPSPDHGLKKVPKVKRMIAMTYPKTTGILTIVSILLCSLIALMGLARFSCHGWDSLQALLTWSFSLITIGFSSAGVLLTLKRKETTLEVASTILMMASGALSLLIYNGWIFGTPTLMITTLSLAYHKFSNNGLGETRHGDSSY